MSTRKLERAIDRLLKSHREYYEGWLKAWFQQSCSHEWTSTVAMIGGSVYCRHCGASRKDSSHV